MYYAKICWEWLATSIGCLRHLCISKRDGHIIWYKQVELRYHLIKVLLSLLLSQLFLETSEVFVLICDIFPAVQLFISSTSPSLSPFVDVGIVYSSLRTKLYISKYFFYFLFCFDTVFFILSFISRMYIFNRIMDNLSSFFDLLFIW